MINETPNTGYTLDSAGNKINIVDIIKSFSATIGSDGSVIISNTDTYTPNNNKIFFCFEGLEGDAVIASASGNSENIANTTIGKHGKIYGMFSNVKLSSGKIIAYMRGV